MTARKNKQQSTANTPLLEWLVGGLGVILLVATVVFLVYEGLHNGEQPGAVTASVKEIVNGGDLYILTFELHNAGSQTLSNVHVSARVMDGEREIERAQTVIDYLPGRSRQAGGFFFQNDPQRYRVEIVPEGYQKL